MNPDEQGDADVYDGDAIASPAAPLTDVAKDEPIRLTKEDVASIVSGAVTESRKQTETERQQTQEELDKAFNVFKVTPEHVTKLLTGLRGEDEQSVEAVRAHLNDMFQAIARQAVTIAGAQLARWKSEFNEQFKPYAEILRTQQYKQLADEFYRTYPEFQGREALVDQVAKNLTQNASQTLTKEQAFEAVAANVREILKQLGLESNPASAGGDTGKRQQATTGSRMPPLSSGGQIGGSQTSNKGGGPPGLEVFFD